MKLVLLVQEPWVPESLRHFAQVDGYEVCLCDINEELLPTAN